MREKKGAQNYHFKIVGRHVCYGKHTYRVKYHNGIGWFRVSHIADKTCTVKKKYLFKGESVSNATANAILVTKVQICYVQMLLCLAAEVKCPQ